jgi:DNA-binding MarR family transcriptional regulator
MTQDSPVPPPPPGIGAVCAAFNTRKASRVLTRLYAEAFAPVGLEATQFALLATCSRQPVVTFGELAVRLSMDPSALARNVAVMQRRRLLKVQPGEDRRVRNVSITAQGRKTLARALPLWRGAQAKLARQFGEEQFVAAVEVIKAMSRAGEALLDQPKFVGR